MVSIQIFTSNFYQLLYNNDPGRAATKQTLGNCTKSKKVIENRKSIVLIIGSFYLLFCLDAAVSTEVCRFLLLSGTANNLN
ncbi:hypothetical protein CHS0354_022430, partial [Potamilus streckersoni]